MKKMIVRQANEQGQVMDPIVCERVIFFEDLLVCLTGAEKVGEVFHQDVIDIQVLES